MGLFSFLKGSGDKEIDTAAENRTNAINLINTIKSYGFDVEGLDIIITGETATVWGEAPDQATREKVLLTVGNTKGIASVDDKMTTKEPAPEAKMHTVVSGESLSKIAKKYYGDAMKYTVIFEANKPTLKDPDKIYPGQVLRIPEL